MIVPRKEMKNTLATLIGILMRKDYTKDPKKNGKKDGGEMDARGGGSPGEKEHPRSQ